MEIEVTTATFPESVVKRESADICNAHNDLGQSANWEIIPIAHWP